MTGSPDVGSYEEAEVQPGAGLQLFIYTSRLREDLLATASRTATVLDDIAAAAQRNNPRLGLTGVLLFDQGTVVQALEGPGDGLRELISVLSTDVRHHGIRCLLTEELTRRTFGQWSMRVDSMDPEAPGIDPGLLLKFRDTYRRVFRPDARQFMRLLQRLLAES